jgi:hypothetical protein
MRRHVLAGVMLGLCAAITLRGNAFAVNLHGSVRSVAASQSRSGSEFVVLVRPSIAPAPATVRIEAQVAPSSENRMLQIAMDSGDYYRGSQVELDGDAAARVHTVEFRGVPAGTYDVEVALVDASGGVRAASHSTIQVVG